VEVYPPGGGEEVPAHADRPESERVVIVDLKTGRSEDRVSDAKVVDDPQLAAYQLALLEGHVPGADPTANAGARLLVLSKTLKNTQYRLARQEPMTPDVRAEFLRRIVDVAAGMAADSFDARLDTHCRTDRFAVCGIHTVKAVSAS
jgi:RecB family exonuclease